MGTYDRLRTVDWYCLARLQLVRLESSSSWPMRFIQLWMVLTSWFKSGIPEGGRIVPIFHDAKEVGLGIGVVFTPSLYDHLYLGV
jgi:hypothetical protein